MGLSKISSEELIEELDSRDILKELGEKGEWLKEKGYEQVPFNFLTFRPTSNSMFYTYKYITSNSLEIIQEQRKSAEELRKNF
ncbi:hypothetical protein [Helcococcus bovis]|uniref:hypothetical protein n=1 Tax=Helcococcus bovis TaxID=3153252 RepID=UPI0038BCA3BB